MLYLGAICDTIPVWKEAVKWIYGVIGLSYFQKKVMEVKKQGY